MKLQLLKALSVVMLFSIPFLSFAQAPPLGTAANFVLFSTVGAVGNTGISQITGNVGTNNGAITGFGNVNGVMHTGDGASAQCAADLLIAYNQLNSTVPTFFPAPLLGNGQILNAGVYSISGAATLNLDLTLNGQGNAGAVFIFKIQGPFSTAANSKVKLTNGALACNVFWKVEGLVSMAAGTFMRGTVIANNAAIEMNTVDTLEGRALSTAGAVTVHGVLAYTPTGCGSPVLTGPAAPSLASTECYAIFSSNGAVTNAGVTHVTGDVGTNVGLTIGFNPLFVTGTIHPIPDGSTAQCATDLGNVYTYLNTLPTDIELLYPAQFGNDLVLTPHTYLMNAATTFTGNIYLNAQGNANAVFVIKINGTLSTGTYSKVILINGTLAKNVYWKVDGAVSINDYSEFEGTIVCNNGAMLLATGVTLDGRALTTTGALSTASMTATITIAGAVSGGGTIFFGMEGSLNLEGNTGSVVKWQKRWNSGDWQDIAETSTTYSEVPDTTGTWDYRAEVQSGNCTALFSTYATVTVLPVTRTINLKVFLEGLFNPVTSQMNKAQDGNGDKFPGTVADKILVRIAKPTVPYTIYYSANDIDLNQDGSCTVTIPRTGSYYLVVRHRNSIETWSSAPVSLLPDPISYDFSTAASQAYGDNLKEISGKWVIYGGDVSQDGLVDSSDMLFVEADSDAFATGYLVADVNGDGLVDLSDMIIVEQNNNLFISSILP